MDVLTTPLPRDREHYMFL